MNFDENLLTDVMCGYQQLVRFWWSGSCSRYRNLYLYRISGIFA